MIIRKASLQDVEAMHHLVNTYAEKGVMLARSRSLLYENIRNFAVAEINGEVVGTGSLHIMWIDLAEIQALAVKKEYTRQGIGGRLVEYFLAEAAALRIPKVFALTYRTEFFQQYGFEVIDKECLPQKVWKECINCPKFPNCDEVCVIKNLDLK